MRLDYESSTRKWRLSKPRLLPLLPLPLPLLHRTARVGLRIDLDGVDAIVNGVARASLRGGGALRRLQTGVVTNYALAMMAGVIAAIAVFAVVWR